MPNNYLSVLYKHIIQVENENWGGGGHKHTIAPPIKNVGGHMSHCPLHPPRFLRQFNDKNDKQTNKGINQIKNTQHIYIGPYSRGNIYRPVGTKFIWGEGGCERNELNWELGP